LFASPARGDDRPGSDVDIRIEIDSVAGMTVFDCVDLKEFITTLFAGPVEPAKCDAPEISYLTGRDSRRRCRARSRPGSGDDATAWIWRTILSKVDGGTFKVDFAALLCGRAMVANHIRGLRAFAR